ncbi:MAG: xanthine dehydrogenase family protein molybdopterin-binding subunit [Clostridiales bacterium]|nr:xanthine dehydrogenase family protein molybdopterin-binding subunit [Clostridiales bacterium]
MAANQLDISLRRPDAVDKAAGKLRYAGDDFEASCLHAALHVSREAHGIIQSVDASGALRVPGVVAVLTGEDCAVRIGSQIEDMPLLARDTVRYCGEPVAMVVAHERWQALQAAAGIRVSYFPLPVVNSPVEAVSGEAPLIHPEMSAYKQAVGDLHPEPNTNIVNHVKIRKGDMAAGWGESEVTVEGHFVLPQAAHGYLETRVAAASIRGDGTVVIETSTQGPHNLRNTIAARFGLSEGQIEIFGYPVGGAYGGKVNGHPEMLAYIASRAAGGRKVALSFPREQCFTSVGCKIASDCTLKLGARKDGKIVALEATYHIDTGAYADTGPRMTVSAACSTGEVYAIDNIQCDALCAYTNHVYATSFRGFGHETSTFCVERMMDKLARALNLDPLLVRRMNLNHAGGTTPTQVRTTSSNFGDPLGCLERAAQMIRWDEGQVVPVGGDRVRAKGLACFTKTSSSPTDASSGAVVLFCADGTVNVVCGVVECGQGFVPSIRQVLAEKLRMDPRRIFVKETIDTRAAPEHWKTVASMSLFMAGNAVLSAADDAIEQLKKMGAVALRCQAGHLEVGGERVYQVSDPEVFIEIKHLVGGIKLENGIAIGGQIIGRGSYVMEHLTALDTETGRGRTGPYWTPVAQAVEIEYDRRDCTYRLLRAVTAIDEGKVIHAAISRGQVTGGMHMGLSVATREHFTYDGRAQLEQSSFRTYKVMHFGECPAYDVAFLETPNLDGPFGYRGINEHGVIGMAAALANALSAATGREMDELPLTFETVWRLAGKGAGA